MSRIIIEEVLAQPQTVTWLPWAVQYFFFIGLSACAALLACVARWARPEKCALFEGRCLFIALTCGITAPLALTADLHQTARFWHFYAWPTPWSWMPWGALFLPLFTLLLGLWFLLFHLRHTMSRGVPVMRWLALGAALTAIGLLLYTGREVSVVRARPLWFSYWYPLVMFASAMSALLALLMTVMRTRRDLVRLLAKGLVATLLLLAAVMMAWFWGDTLSGEALRQQWQLNAEMRFYALTVIALWGISLAFALYTCRYALPVGATLAVTLVGAAMCWVLRWAFVIGGQEIPKFNALMNAWTLPSGTDGWLAIIGTFGLWFALMITLREGVNWLSRRLQHA